LALKPVKTTYTTFYLFILNGMGTRGVLFAPYLSDKLFQYIENKTELDNEISIERIYKKLFR
jgi:hypothetical protein